ncbi:MAG: hypothetical protein N2234_01290 [Planctomycetota bacterium]|nr:hypothetical protein [Planctomycetota bacterium]
MDKGRDIIFSIWRKQEGSVGLIFLAVLGFLAAGVLGTVAYINYSQLKQCKEELDKTETDLRGEKKALKEQNAQLEEENKKMRSQITEAQMELTKLQVAKDTLQRQADEQKERIGDLTRKAGEMETLRVSLSEKNEQIKKVESLLKEKEEEISRLLSELSISKEEASKGREGLLKERDELAARLSEANATLVRREKEVTNLKEKLRQCEAELNKTAAVKSSDIEKLKSDVANKEKEINDLKKVIDELREDKERLLTQIALKQKEEERLSKEFLEELVILAGPQGTRGDMDIRVSNSTLAGSKINLTRQLDMELDTVGIFAEFTGKGRFGFSLNFFQIYYEGSTTLAETVRFAGMTANAGDDINTYFSTLQGGVTLHINFGSVFRSRYRRIELGILAGARYVKYTGEIEDVTTGSLSRESLSAFLPLAGFTASYHIGADVSIIGKLFGGYFTYGFYSAPNFLEASLALSLRLMDHIRLELGYLSSNIHIRYDDTDTGDSFRVEHSFEGPFLALVAAF